MSLLVWFRLGFVSRCPHPPDGGSRRPSQRKSEAPMHRGWAGLRPHPARRAAAQL